MPPHGRPTVSSGINGRHDILDYIRAHGPVKLSAREFARRLGFNHMTVYNHLRRMQDDGLLKRRSDGSWEVA